MPMPRSRVPVRVTLAAAMVAIASGMEAQIRVNPTTVDVNSQGPTTVFLTYGFTADYQPAEAVWCRDLISAAPATKGTNVRTMGTKRPRMIAFPP